MQQHHKLRRGGCQRVVAGRSGGGGASHTNKWNRYCGSKMGRSSKHSPWTQDNRILVQIEGWGVILLHKATSCRLKNSSKTNDSCVTPQLGIRSEDDEKSDEKSEARAG